MSAAWTDDRVKVLRMMWLEGRSASQIAASLGGVSRNGVIGKVHRLGISLRETASAPKPAAAARRPAATSGPSAAARAASQTAAVRRIAEQAARPERVQSAPVAPMPEPTPELVVVGQAVVLVDLKPNCCRYPVGPTPPPGDMHLQLFCAAPTGDQPGRPYCDKHEEIAWKPSTAADKAKRMKNDINAAHRDMVTRNRHRHTTATRAVL